MRLAGLWFGFMFDALSLFGLVSLCCCLCGGSLWVACLFSYVCCIVTVGLVGFVQSWLSLVWVVLLYWLVVISVVVMLCLLGGLIVLIYLF